MVSYEQETKEFIFNNCALPHLKVVHSVFTVGWCTVHSESTSVGVARNHSYYNTLQKQGSIIERNGKACKSDVTA